MQLIIRFMNKLSLVGMQLPEKYKEISTFRAKALHLELRRAFARNVEILLIFSVH
jgi:hypothetical protein